MGGDRDPIMIPPAYLTVLGCDYDSVMIIPSIERYILALSGDDDPVGGPLDVGNLLAQSDYLKSKQKIVSIMSRSDSCLLQIWRSWTPTYVLWPVILIYICSNIIFTLKFCLNKYYYYVQYMTGGSLAFFRDKTDGKTLFWACILFLYHDSFAGSQTCEVQAVRGTNSSVGYFVTVKKIVGQRSLILLRV
jgi:hypothetical protein